MGAGLGWHKHPLRSLSQVGSPLEPPIHLSHKTGIAAVGKKRRGFLLTYANFSARTQALPLWSCRICSVSHANCIGHDESKGRGEGEQRRVHTQPRFSKKVKTAIAPLNLGCTTWALADRWPFLLWLPLAVPTLILSLPSLISTDGYMHVSHLYFQNHRLDGVDPWWGY